MHSDQYAVNRGMVPDIASGTYPADLLIPAMKRTQLLGYTGVVVMFEIAESLAEPRGRELSDLLKILVSEVRESGGPGQLVFRMTATRIAVLISQETLSAASSLADVTRRRFCERARFEHGTQCSVSGGVATFTAENGARRALEQSIQALRLAQNWGGAKVVEFEPSVPIIAANDRPARALVVEDDESIRALMRETLIRAGFDVTEAGDGAEGFRTVSTSAFDLVVLDVMMPNVGGLEMCQQMRSHDELSRIPVLMVSALSDPVDRVEGLDVANDYMCKPFSCDELVARARALLRRNPPPAKVSPIHGR
jgi:PleD family two-component response regulator